MVDTLQHITRLSFRDEELAAQEIHPTLGRRDQVCGYDIPEQTLAQAREGAQRTIDTLREKRRIPLRVWSQPFTV